MKDSLRLLVFVLLLSILEKVWRAVKIEKLINTTSFKPYTESTSFPHLSFDTPLQQSDKLVDYDSQNVYLLARESFADLTTYRFMSVKHSDLSSTYKTVYITGYEINGMCQYKGKLDYFIGLHTKTGELRVCNFKTNNNSTLAPLYCKVIPKQMQLEPHYIYSDWVYTGTVNSMNTYVIGIGGSGFDPSHPGQYNYMYAKFNTKHNLTESLVESNDPDVSERLVDVKVDPVNEQIYVVLDINSNKYKDVSIYEAGDELTENNPNVALVAYSFNNAVINWIKIFGDLNNVDYYVDLEQNIIVLNSYTSMFSENKGTSKDILAYKFRYETGYIIGKLSMGSPSDDTAYDLITHFHGAYILASIGNNFSPHANTGSVWGTPNNETTFAHIWINDNFKLLDIEGYAESSLTTLPMRGFPSIPDVYEPQFMFISPAGKEQLKTGISLYQNGALFTQYSNPLRLFISTDCNLTWVYCSRYYNDNNRKDCIYWDVNKSKVLYKGQCLSGWGSKTYQLIDEITETTTKHCEDCHYSCKNWLGPKKDQCSTCCMNSECGSALLDRAPKHGTCEWPSGSYDSHGLWLERWVNGLYARLDKMCYEYWPKNTYPEIKFDDAASSNEYTHYEEANDTDWVDYNNLLKFNLASKGIEIPGPVGLSSMPKEFTLSFWIRAELLSSETFIMNLFQRIHIKIVSSNVRFLFERSANDYIEPTYSGVLNQISTNVWVYISVSQKENLETNLITQKLVIGNGRSSQAIEAGSKINHAPASYSKFVNTIFLGGLSYSDPKSFTGYIKEVKLFQQFHDSPQMINDRLRVHLIHSFEDLNLIAYWKLSENYTITDTVQTINDYSKHNMNKYLSVSFSPSTNPDYPTFVHNQTLGLKLCFYNDVANCRAIKGLPKILSKPWRILNPSNFKLDSWSHTLAPGDRVEFKTGSCQSATTNAAIKRVVGNKWEAEPGLSPEDLSDGLHYYVCYTSVQKGFKLDLGQIYIAKTSTKVDPSDISSFIIVGLEIQIEVSGGDEAYGDILRFSENWDSPKTTDLQIQRNNNYNYAKLVAKNFKLPRRYQMCIIPTYSSDLNFYMDNINSHEWIAAGTPQLGTSNTYSFFINDKPLKFQFESPFTEGDKVVFAWKRETDLDCDSANILSPEYVYQFGNLPMIWLGNSQGINGITQQKEEIHMCWKSTAIGGDPSYSRVALVTGHNYKFLTKGYTDATRTPLPELSSIYPHYGSTEIYGTDAQIQFNFGNQNVFPAKRAGVKGKLAVFRGAVKYDGSIDIMTSSVVYQIATLDEAHAPNNLEQGNLKCTALGSCNLTLSAATSTGLKPGEIYFLALFPNSFSNNIASQYYLFANNTNGGNAIYHHMFSSRSFNIIATPTNKVFGKTLVIEGENLLQISNVLAKESLGSIVTATWVTKSIKIHLRFSGSTCSSSLLPFASVYMKNVNSTHITVKNMDLKGCMDGNLIADFEIIRGIKDGLNKYSHLRREYQKDVALGQVGCHASCKTCSGPSVQNWLICNNYATEFLLEGQCTTTWPTTHPYWQSVNVVYESTEYVTKHWVSAWEKGYFINPKTKECESWNLDCQTCNTNEMAGWITCNPIKYYYHGICTEVCPEPAYKAQNSNYQWIKQNTTDYIKVEILKNPYLHKIPRNKQFYLKAYINNTRGVIDTAQWTQISPPYKRVTDNVFTMDINNITNEVYNSQLTLKFRMTSFTYISELTSIKIMLRVNNTMGDVATQLSEFYINPAPVVGIIQQEILTGQTKPQDSNCTMRFRLTSWYDTIDDTSQMLKFKFYYQYEGNTFILKDAGSLETFDVVLPYISATDNGKRVSIEAWVSATDKYLAISSKCITLKDILLTYTEDKFEALTKSALTIISAQVDELLVMLASLEIIMPEYLRSPTHPHICTIDFHCYNGICNRAGGNNHCSCDQGYSGLYCQYKSSIYNNLKVVMANFFSYTWTRFGALSDFELFDFDVLITSLRGMLKDFELIPNKELEKLVELFEKASYMENHKVIALQDQSLQLYFQTAERVLGKIYLERKRVKADPTHLRYPGMSINDALTAEKAEKDRLNELGYKVHNAIIRFMKEIMFRLDITTNEYVYIGTMAFEFKVSAGYPPDYEDKKFYIKNSDIYWEIPTGIFSQYQDVASYKQQIYVMGVKWLANPHLLNGKILTQVGTNMTTFAFFDNKGNELQIKNINTPISIVFPYSKSTGYNIEFLKCQYFDTETKNFKKDGCAHAFVPEVKLPCTTWDVDDSYITTDVFVCRCNHLTTIGGVYEPNSVSKRSDPRVGIYLTYFAMNYWKKSFGYYLLWPATILYGVSLSVAIIIDCFTLSKMRRKIEERIIHVGEANEKQAKEAELKGLLEEEKKLDSEISPDAKGKSKPKSKGKRKKGLDDTVVEDKGYHSQGDNDSAIDALNITGDHVLAPMPKKKKKIIKRKVLKKKAKNNFVQEEGGEEEKKNGLNRYASTSSIAIRMPVEEEKEVSLHSGLRQSKINGGKKLKKKKIIRKKKKKPLDTFDDLNSKADTKIQGSGSKVDDNMLSHYNSEGDKDKEGSVSSDPDTKEVSPEEAPKIHKMPTTVDVFESSRNFWSMLLYSNTFCNLIFVTSYLCPRHIRISMLYTNLILIWFLVAVFYNNTKDPLVVPDFEAKARSLAMSEIWIALAAPLVSMSISYIFWGVFRVSDKRFHQPDSYLRVKDGQMMKALLREMYLRFAMAYFIMMAIFSAVLWYIIEFTAKFGWKVSWQWWYSGSFAFLFNYLFYDPLITWFHFVMHGCSQILWRKVMAFRGIKIACPEVLDHLHIPPLEDPNQKGENNPDGQAQNADDAEPREP